MAFNKIKRIIATALVISVIIPTINVQALENKNTINTEVTDTIKEGNEEVLKEGQSVDELNGETKSNLDNTSEVETDLDKTEEDEQNNLNDTEVLENKENVENKVEENKEVEVETKTEVKSEEKVTSNIEKTEESLKGKVYSTKKAKTSTTSLVRSFSMGENTVADEPEEYKIKKAELENLEVLVTMTDSKYELTLANSDGSYEYVDSYDEFNKAKTAAVDLSTSGEITEEQVPAVVSNAGNVVYATNQMGRMLISRSNVITYEGVVYLYPTSDLGTAFTYVNVGSMEDVPVLDMTDKAAKVMINGHVGWISNNISSGTYNMKLVPLTKSINPSYYTVRNGELVHFISYNLEEGTRGANLTLGKAPSYLKEGAKYLSYDGNYFYDYTLSNLSTKLNSLIGDYRTGSRMASTNRSNPFYNYYQYLPFRSKTVYTATEIDRYIANNTASNSKLRGLGTSLKEAETKYGVNAILALAVAINESGFGTSNIAMTKNNLFGIAAFDSDPNQSTTFATAGASVLEFSKNYISEGYSDPADWRYYGGFLGNKDRGVNVKYASDPYWGEKAAQHAYSVDKYLSGGKTNLKDTNSKQIGMAISNNSVIKKDGSSLYNITTDLSQYASYQNIPFVINDIQKVTINNESYYEINPEITNPLYAGGKLQDFDGNYNWNTKGYIKSSNVSLLNVYIPTVSELSGKDRYETSVALSKSQFTKSDYVVLVNGTAIIDGVSATPLAVGLNAPILLTQNQKLPTSVKNEIKRLGVTKVVAVGGYGIISPDIVQELEEMGITNWTRLGGNTRYDTSLEVAKYIDENIYDISDIVIAAGNGEADALSISAVSGERKMPIILSEKSGPNETITKWLKGESIGNAYVIGGTGVISSEAMVEINKFTANSVTNNRLGGSDRYETNAKVIEKFYGDTISKAYVTVGMPLADALGAGVIAALNKSPLILTATDLKDIQKSVLKTKNANSIVKVGGGVSTTSLQNLKELLSRTQ